MKSGIYVKSTVKQSCSKHELFTAPAACSVSSHNATLSWEKNIKECHRRSLPHLLTDKRRNSCCKFVEFPVSNDLFDGL